MGVCMCVCHHQPNHQYTATYMCREAHFEMCVCAREIKRGYGLLVCVCMYMYVHATERLRLHKTVILLLIMEMFCIENSLLFSYNYTIQPYQ